MCPASIRFEDQCLRNSLVCESFFEDQCPANPEFCEIFFEDFLFWKLSLLWKLLWRLLLSWKSLFCVKQIVCLLPGMKVRCWHEVGLHMTDYYARTHHHKSVKILQKNKLHHGEERKDHHMQVWHCCRIVVFCFFFLRSVFLWEIHFDLPSFFPSFLKFWEAAIKKILSLSLSFVMPLSRQTHTERSTMTEPPRPCIESCAVCGLGEPVRRHTNGVRKQLVVLPLWFVRFPNLWWVDGWGQKGFGTFLD